MSKAEERALEAYPVKEEWVGNQYGGPEDVNKILREKYTEGYHQAEKDLLENEHEQSWRLNEKLWKGIKDVEEASYQYMYDASNDWAYDIPTWEDVQDAFKAGSEWKEGLELTWKDMELIYEISCDVFNEQDGHFYNVSKIWEEILKQFKDFKERKEK